MAVVTGEKSAARIKMRTINSKRMRRMMMMMRPTRMVLTKSTVAPSESWIRKR